MNAELLDCLTVGLSNPGDIYIPVIPPHEQMEYRDRHGKMVTPLHMDSDSPVRLRVCDEVVPRVPDNTWKDVPKTDLPLRYDTSPWTLVNTLFPHCTGDLHRTHAVYVLECLQNHHYARSALRDVGRVKSARRDAHGEARRRLYVGVTEKLIRRINQHLNDPGAKGAQFTAVFPLIRVLDVSWWRTKRDARRAEVIIAGELRERFTNDYVSQPG